LVLVHVAEPQFVTRTVIVPGLVTVTGVVKPPDGNEYAAHWSTYSTSIDGRYAVVA
jgi:hypothetical protein